MARAKRTDRAAARRRYRATNLPTDVAIDDVETPSVETTAPVRGDGRSSGSSRGAAAPRPSLMTTLRQAAGRPNIMEDVRALPDIALHSKALWLPLLLILVASILFFIPGLQRNPLVAMVGQIALTPPPMIMPFLGGMLAPRGAWLVGGIIGLANSLGFLVLVVVNTNAQATPLGWTYQVSSDQKVGYMLNALLSAVPFGILVGSFAGFYRRFLAASAPARQPARSNSRRR